MNETSAQNAEQHPADEVAVVKRETSRRSIMPRRRAGGLAKVAASAQAPQKKMKPVRTAGILVAVAGLIATVGLPAVAAVTSSANSAGANSVSTVQQQAANGARELVVTSDAAANTVDRGSYSATTPEEIEKKKAEEAALARAKAAQEAAAAAAAASSSQSSRSVSVPNVNLSMPGGDVRWVLGQMTSIGDGFLSRGGSHQGVDFVAPAMTPIYSAAAGTVVQSAESIGGYGVAIVIAHNIGGQKVETLYGHMTYGTRQVQVGDTVAAGQLIGFVGTTGRSTGNHLHFETSINGSNVDPEAWLEANGVTPH